MEQNQCPTLFTSLTNFRASSSELSISSVRLVSEAAELVGAAAHHVTKQWSDVLHGDGAFNDYLDCGLQALTAPIVVDALARRGILPAIVFLGGAAVVDGLDVLTRQ